MIFDHSVRSYSDKFRLLQRRDIRSTAIPHTRTDTADQLVNRFAQRSFERNTRYDALGHEFVDIALATFLEITVGQPAFMASMEPMPR